MVGMMVGGRVVMVVMVGVAAPVWPAAPFLAASTGSAFVASRGSQQRLDLLHEPPRRVQVVDHRLGLHPLPHPKRARLGRWPRQAGRSGGGAGPPAPPDDGLPFP